MPMLALIVLASVTLSLGPAQHDHATGAEKLGTVNFPTSCSAAAQAQFNRAVALLHSFEFSAGHRRVHRHAGRRSVMRDGGMG